MGISAGAKIRAADHLRVGNTVNTSSTAAFTTTETVTDSVTFTAVAGVVYEIIHDAFWNSSASGDWVAIRCRETDVAGTAVQGRDLYLPTSTRYPGSYLRAQWTAPGSGAKTFVITGQRVAGTGNVIRAASAINASRLTVDQIQ